MLDTYYSKVVFLKSHDFQDLIQTFNQGVATFFEETQRQQESKAVVRSIQFDLCYIMFRHLSWVHAPILAGLTVDYLNSEYRLPNPLATELVDLSLALLKPYIPIENGWGPETYNYEFLFQLFITCASARNETQLSADIGFGGNVIELLEAAANLEESKPGEHLVFAPQLTLSLNQMIREVSEEVEVTPWILDLYQLKLRLENPSDGKMKQFDREKLEYCFEVMYGIGWKGALWGQLAKGREEGVLKAVLTQLMSAQLVYSQKSGKRDSYHLSQDGYGIIAERAATQWGVVSPEDFKGVPGPIQTKLIENLPKLPSEFLQDMFSQLYLLEPAPVFLLISRLAEENPGSIGELLPLLPCNKMNSWAKFELCRALSKFEINLKLEDFLETMSRSDSSSRVRQQARISLEMLRQGAVISESEHAARYQ